MGIIGIGLDVIWIYITLVTAYMMCIVVITHFLMIVAVVCMLYFVWVGLCVGHTLRIIVWP